MYIGLNLIPLEDRIVLDGAIAAALIPAITNVVQAADTAHTLYVDAGVAGGNHTGDSWVNAYSDLQTALTRATVGSSWDIKVAPGIYTPPSHDGYTLNPGASVLIEGSIDTQTGTPTNTPTSVIDGLGFNTASLLTLNNNNVVIEDVIFQNGVTSTFATAGALTINNHSTVLLIRDSFVSNDNNDQSLNAQAGLGGAVYVENSDLYVSNSTFAHNSAGGGGAIAVVTLASDTLTHIFAIDGSTFTGNDGVNNGGAIFANNIATFAISNSNFSTNSAVVTGGAIYVFDNPFVLSGGSIDTHRLITETSNPHSTDNTAQNISAADFGLALTDLNLDTPSDPSIQITGRLIGDNHDVYRVYIRAGETITADVDQGISSNFIDTTLTLRDANGNQVAFNDDVSVADGGDNGYIGFSHIVYTASTDGYYTIDLGKYSPYDSDENYILNVSINERHRAGSRLIVETNIPHSTDATAQIVNVADLSVAVDPNLTDPFLPSLQITGTLVSADPSVYRVFLQAGQIITVDVDNAGLLNPISDTTLTLTDGNGINVAFNDDASPDTGSVYTPDMYPGNSLFTYSVTQSGFYFISVAKYDPFVPDGNYLLNVSVDSSNIVATAGGGGAVAIYHTTFSDNLAGLVTVVTGGTSTIDGGQGGALFTHGGDISIDTSTFNNNTTGGNGGASYSTTSLSFFIHDSSFTGNSSIDGGAIYETSSNGNVTVEGGSFNNNLSSGDGGGIYASHNTHTVTINFSTFTDNQSVGGGTGGGALFMDANDSILVSGSTFNDNTSSQFGGAIAVENNVGAITVENSDFTNNSATSSGGALYSFVNGSFAVSNTTFTNSSSGGNGGAIRDNFNGGSSFVNNTFINNSAAGNGGAIASTGNGVSSLLLQGDMFTQNTANRGGALDFFQHYDVSISSSSFRDNTSWTFGGAIATTGTDNKLSLDNDTFEYNNAILDGGALYTIGNHDVSVSNTLFTGNTSGGNGGAIATTGDISEDRYLGGLQLENNTFTQNSAFNGGAVYVNEYRRVNINNNNFVNNAAGDHGGAIYAAANFYDNVLNNTFTENTSLFGGAIAVVGVGNVSISGNTFSAGSAPFGSELDLQLISKINDVWTSDRGVINSLTTNNTGLSESKVHFAGTINPEATLYVDVNNLSPLPQTGADWLHAVSNLQFVACLLSAAANWHVEFANGIYVVPASGFSFNVNSITFKGGSQGVYGSVVNTTIFQGPNSNEIVANAGSFTIFAGSLRITGITLANFTQWEPIIWAEYTTLELIDVNFIDNSATGGQGLIMATQSEVTLTNNSFVNNHALESDNVGVINVIQGSNLAVHSSTFTSNSVGAGGAVIAALNANIVTFDNSTFTDNSTDRDGGAVYINSVNRLSIHNSTFSGNSAANRGGAVTVLSTGVVSITSSHFDYNRSGQNGGAIFSSSVTSLSFTNNTFTGNTSLFGGAIAVQTGVSATILGNIFTADYAFNGAELNLQLIDTINGITGRNSSIFNILTTNNPDLSNDEIFILGAFNPANPIYVDLNNHSGLPQTGEDWTHALSDLNLLASILKTPADWHVVFANGVYDLPSTISLTGGSIILEGGGHGVYSTSINSTIFSASSFNGIDVSSGALTVTGITFMNFSGGTPINVKHADLTLTNDHFINTAFTAVVASYSGAISIVDSTFLNNFQGISIQNNGVGGVFVNNSTFINNSGGVPLGSSTTHFGGGAILVNGSKGLVSINNSTFTNNNVFGNVGGNYQGAQRVVSSGNGGAIISTSAEQFSVVSCHFTNNNAVGNGGAIYAIGSKTFNFINNTFEGNVATSGGAISCHGALSTTMTGNTFVLDSATTGSEVNFQYVGMINGVSSLNDSAFDRLTADNLSLERNEIAISGISFDHTIYVDANNTSSLIQTGSDWAHAFSNVQFLDVLGKMPTLLNVAFANGIYYLQHEINLTNSDLTITFEGGGHGAYSSPVDTTIFDGQNSVMSYDTSGHDLIFRNGGGIEASCSTLKVTGITFTNFHFNNVIRSLDTTLILNNDQFINNTINASGRYVSGGAVAVNGGDIVSIEDCVFRNNIATGSTFVIFGQETDRDFLGGGGAVDIYGAGAVFINHSRFIGNTGTTWTTSFKSQGGAIDLFKCEIVSISNSTFINNATGDAGGALKVGNSGAVSIINSDFTANRIINTPINLEGSLIPGEAARWLDNNRHILTWTEGGGAAWFDSNESVFISNSQFSFNFSSVYGGALGFAGTIGVVAIDNTVFFHNTSLSSGGALFALDNNSLSVSNSLFSSNRTVLGIGNGGAIRDEGNGSSSFTQNQFVSNSAGGFGGAIAITANNSFIKTSLLSGNIFSDNSAAAGIANVAIVTFINGTAYGTAYGTSYFSLNEQLNNALNLEQHNNENVLGEDSAAQSEGDNAFAHGNATQTAVVSALYTVSGSQNNAIVFSKDNTLTTSEHVVYNTSFENETALQTGLFEMQSNSSTVTQNWGAIGLWIWAFENSRSQYVAAVGLGAAASASAASSASSTVLKSTQATTTGLHLVYGNFINWLSSVGKSVTKNLAKLSMVLAHVLHLPVSHSPIVTGHTMESKAGLTPLTMDTTVVDSNDANVAGIVVAEPRVGDLASIDLNALNEGAQSSINRDNSASGTISTLLEKSDYVIGNTAFCKGKLKVELYRGNN